MAAPLRLDYATLVRSSEMHPYDDAHFAGPVALGVADGVGGWRDKGYDPGAYARQFMAHCAMNPSSNPMHRMDNAHHWLASFPALMGTTTACIATLHGHTLHAANLGDSTFLVLRGTEVLARATPKYIGKMPAQIGNRPPSEASTVEALYNTADAADQFYVHVRAGDVVLMATDGVRQLVPDLENITSRVKDKPLDKFVRRIAEDIGKNWDPKRSDDATLVCARVVLNA